MLSFILSFLGSAIIWIVVELSWTGSHPVWCSIIGIVSFFAIFILINRRINKSLEVILKDVQQKIIASQERLKREIQMYQQKGQFGKAMQEKMEKKQADTIHAALPLLDAIEPFRKWNFIAGRQADMLRGQLLYQIKEYEAAAPFLEKSFAIDPLIFAMKMALKYRQGELEEVEKMYHKGVKRFKGDKTVLIYALYSWILVKNNKIQDATIVLDEAKKETENKVLKDNWEHLANGRVKRFSNAELGEQWFSLNLEEQKPIRQKAQLPFGGHAKHMMR